MASLKKAVKDKKMKAGFIMGLGASNNIEIAFFDSRKKKYITKKLKSDYEITALIGNISYLNNEPIIHAHVNLSDENYQTVGGHLISAVISGTFEGLILTLPISLKRKFDKKAGLNLLDI